MAKPKLGQTAYVINSKSVPVRTIVNVLYPEGRYGVLDHGSGQNFLSFSEACHHALESLKEREKALQEELRSIAGLRAKISAPEYRQEVDAFPLAYGPTAGFLAGSTAGAASVPGSYFEPEEEVFAVITPKTHYSFGGRGGPPYFVLCTTICKTSIQAGYLMYWLNASFIVSAHLVFGSAQEARQKLVGIFAQETGGTLGLENVEVIYPEKAGTKKDMFSIGA